MLQKWWIKNPYKADHTKCSNGHGYHFLKFHYDNIWVINVHPPTNPPKPMFLSSNFFAMKILLLYESFW